MAAGVARRPGISTVHRIVCNGGLMRREIVDCLTEPADDPSATERPESIASEAAAELPHGQDGGAAATAPAAARSHGVEAIVPSDVVLKAAISIRPALEASPATPMSLAWDVPV